MSTRYSAESDALFASLFELSPDARAEAIEVACVDRPALRRDVESLLAAYDAAQGFLQKPCLTTDAEPDREDLAGSRIGAFRVIGPLGRGGMSDVYRAERGDGTFDQHVAIKVARVPLTDPEAMRRFKAERQILAVLQHPHIVTLIDGGALPDGRPYLVTELVAGTTITAHCRTSRLRLEDRLRLFRQVCEAVHYAHGHGVVHRDLKPANLLVTAEGVPKVLDFGVAKLLAPWPGVDGQFTTATLAGPLTPNYASPEQVRGLSVTTASDVYTLGILLYEILAAARPYETSGRPLDDVMQLVVNTHPARPSAAKTKTRTTGRHASPPTSDDRGTHDEDLPYDRRRLRGDLDAIVLKAMAKEPERRYASAAELADDIARYLGGKPVLARGPSAAYTLRKLAARHKALVATGLIAAIGVLASLGVALWQRAQADRQRAAAERRFAEVRQLAHDLIFDIHDAVVPLPGSTPVRKQIVERALAYLERLRAEANGDPGLQIELSAAYRQIGEVLGVPSKPNLGDRAGAIARLRQARDLVRPLATRPDAGRPSVTALVRADHDLATLMSVQGDTAEGRRLTREALEAIESLVARQPGDASDRELLAIARFHVAMQMGDDGGAPAAWSAVISAFEDLLAQRPDDPDRLRNVALPEKYLGTWYDQHERPAEALPHFRRAMEIDTRRVSLRAEDRQALIDLAIDQANVAGSLRKSGDVAAAIVLLEQSVATRRQLANTDPNDVWTVGRLGAALQRLGYTYWIAHRLQEALVTDEEAIRVLDRAVAGRRDMQVIQDLAVTSTNLGTVYEALGRPAAACAAYRRAEQRYREIDQSDNVQHMIHARRALTGSTCN